MNKRSEVQELPAAEMRGEERAAALGRRTAAEVAELKGGEIVLVLGSGVEREARRAAQGVGASGKVYGLAVAEEAAAGDGATKRRPDAGNLEFISGEGEQIPLADHAVDVVVANWPDGRMSNPGYRAEDEERMWGEAFRVLAPGGRLAIVDVVRHGEIPRAMREDAGWTEACRAAACEENDYRLELLRAGFDLIQIEPQQIYSGEKGREFLAGRGIAAAGAAEMEGTFMSAAIRAVKQFRPRGGQGCTCCG